MLKAPKAPIRGFTPRISKVIAGTAQQIPKETASRGLFKNKNKEFGRYQ